jgi:hypothetical protein
MSNAIRGEVYSCHLNSFYDMPKRLFAVFAIRNAALFTRSRVYTGSGTLPLLLLPSAVRSRTSCIKSKPILMHSCCFVLH